MGYTSLSLSLASPSRSPGQPGDTAVAVLLSFNLISKAFLCSQLDTCQNYCFLIAT